MSLISEKQMQENLFFHTRRRHCQSAEELSESGCNLSDMNLESAEIKYAASLYQLSGLFDPAKSIRDIIHQRNRNVQLMMSGQDPADPVIADLLHGGIEEYRIGSRIKRVKTAFVYQIATEQVFALRIIKTAVTG